MRYDTKEGLEAWQFVADLMTKDKVDSPAFLTGQKKFEQGRAVFYINHPVTRGRLEREAPDIDYSIAPVPSPDGSLSTIGHHWAYVVSKRTANAKVAWEWVKFLTDRQGQAKWVTRARDLPSLVELVGHPDLTQDDKARVSMESLRYARPIQQVGMTEVDEIHNAMWDSIVINNASAAQVVRDGAEKENRILARKVK